MIALAIEASTYAGSVALLDGDRLIAERTVAMRGREHEALMPAVAEVLADAGQTATSVRRVICGAGPGAFTSLRVAGGIAKGLALSTGAPLYAVSSLALLVATGQGVVDGRYLAVMNAMRGELYVQPFSRSALGGVVPVGGVNIIDASALVRTAELAQAVAIGPDQPDARCIVPHARGSALLTKMMEQSGPADLASWEPEYGRLAEAQVKWEAAHGRALVAP